TALGQRLLHASESPIKAAISAVAAQRAPRAKGVTGQVNAARHRAIAPITRPVDVVRPSSAVLDGAPAEPPFPRATPVSGRIAAAVGSDEIEVEHTPLIEPPPPVDATPVRDDATRARSVSGEIRVPSRRAPSIRPPMPEPLEPADEDDAPMIVIEAEASAPTPTPDDDATGSRKLPPPRRRRAAK